MTFERPWRDRVLGSTNNKSDQNFWETSPPLKITARLDAAVIVMDAYGASIFLFLAYWGDCTRSGLDIKMRELVTFAILISMGGCEPQVKGHVQGNINVGNKKEVLLDVITQLLPYLGYPRTLNALRCLNEVDPLTP